MGLEARSVIESDVLREDSAWQSEDEEGEVYASARVEMNGPSTKKGIRTTLPRREFERMVFPLSGLAPATTANAMPRRGALEPLPQLLEKARGIAPDELMTVTRAAMRRRGRETPRGRPETRLR